MRSRSGGPDAWFRGLQTVRGGVDDHRETAGVRTATDGCVTLQVAGSEFFTASLAVHFKHPLLE